MNEFSLNITMGNDAMQTPADVSHVLRKLADQIGDDRFAHDPALPDSGTVRDGNGNTIGQWELK